MGQKSGSNCPGGDFMGGNCPGGSCPGGNYSVAIFWGVKVQRGIVLGEISWGAIVRGSSCSGGSCHGTITKLIGLTSFNYKVK